MKKYIKIPKHSTVLYLSLLAIKMAKGHCSNEVSTAAANAIFIHSAWNIAHERLALDISVCV